MTKYSKLHLPPDSLGHHHQSNYSFVFELLYPSPPPGGGHRLRLPSGFFPLHSLKIDVFWEVQNTQITELL